jgi:hypothetical protein
MKLKPLPSADYPLANEKFARIVDGDRRSPRSVTRSKNQLLGGPTIRFILAVTGPVMGAAAPKREAIKAIIAREKKKGKGYGTLSFKIALGMTR